MVQRSAHSTYLGGDPQTPRCGGRAHWPSRAGRERRDRPLAEITARRLCLAVCPFWRLATARLAARRLISHSHGPESVSSKALMSNTSARFAEAKKPKFARWASPQVWAWKPDSGVAARSAATTPATG